MNKNLNRGTVIAMIKKGWGIDKEMEIHEMPEKNVKVELESPRGGFAKHDDYKRVLKGRSWAIQGVLLNIQPCDDYMVFQEVCFDWCPYWVQFHGLPHVAFNRENAVKLCNVVEGITKEDTAEGHTGNGFGTAYVKTIEEALVVYDKSWDEAKLLLGKSPPKTGQALNKRRIGDRSIKGNSEIHGMMSDFPPPSQDTVLTDQEHVEAFITTHPCRELVIADRTINGNSNLHGVKLDVSLPRQDPTVTS
ncbi:hypothetical protein K1719_034621 [Acacia pycnantha]|nr:hypothetical protein K1719_034621 [Acacia pycnantha]